MVPDSSSCCCCLRASALIGIKEQTRKKVILQTSKLRKQNALEKKSHNNVKLNYCSRSRQEKSDAIMQLKEGVGHDTVKSPCHVKKKHIIGA